MKIKVPNKITKEVEELCHRINEDRQPVYVTVDTTVPASQDTDCIKNVALKIVKDGGDFQFGWAIWEWPSVMLEAEFWVVWVNHDGQLIDVTPRGRGDKILFISDDKTNFEGKPIDSILQPILDHPLIMQYIEINQQIWQRTDALTAAGKSEMAICEVVAPLIEQKDALEKEIDETLSGGVGRNDLCPCGSGKKFKKCCGH
ncbi:MAG: hypothetical protein GX348_10900 [Veillonellaceae bacterium]|mgnify:CR=1 FL=1|jgi:hypothetical protein|nr:hypothetical protein [Veillonellaceae bacterium]